MIREKYKLRRLITKRCCSRNYDWHLSYPGLNSLNLENRVDIFWIPSFRICFFFSKRVFCKFRLLKPIVVRWWSSKDVNPTKKFKTESMQEKGLSICQYQFPHWRQVHFSRLKHIQPNGGRTCRNLMKFSRSDGARSTCHLCNLERSGLQSNEILKWAMFRSWWTKTNPPTMATSSSCGYLIWKRNQCQSAKVKTARACYIWPCTKLRKLPVRVEWNWFIQGRQQCCLQQAT